MSIACCITVKIQFDNISTHHTHLLLGRYARLRVWAPPFRNSGSAPANHYWFPVPGVLSTTGSWFLGYGAPLVPGSWGTEHHWFLNTEHHWLLVPEVLSTTGSWFWYRSALTLPIFKYQPHITKTMYIVIHSTTIATKVHK